jgi:hypothetical protein
MLVNYKAGSGGWADGGMYGSMNEWMDKGKT